MCVQITKWLAQMSRELHSESREDTLLIFTGPSFLDILFI